jgi:serine/threonine-protein kinase
MAGDLSQDDTVAAPSQPPTPPAAAGSGGAAPLRVRADRYTLGAVLGKGGMGEVCAAIDEDIGRDVAVKRLRSPDAGPEAIARFLREARIQARLDHPAIVPVHDLGAGADGRPFFAMKRLAGTTLAEVIARGELAAQRPRLLRAFVEVCLAAEFAHTRGVVHRDLKPANIALGDFGEVYVLDWGIARVLADPDHPAHGSVGADVETLDTGGTSAGAVLGTPGYMPPEQLRGEVGVDARADVYALGCVLFEILAGEPLHPRGTGAVPSTLAGDGLDARPTARGADCPPELEAACVRATRTEPGDRFASARALGDAVQAFLDGDRDVQLRRQLAATHVEAAESAIAGGATLDARARAMREAGRALALDPTSAAAAAVVTRLMLEPPAELPAEVAAEVREHDRASAVRQGRLAVRAMSSYYLFVPFLFWMHISGWTWILFTYGVVTAGIVQAWLTTRKGDPITPRRTFSVVAVNVVLVALISRMFGPYVLAPAIAAGVLGGMAGFPPVMRRYTLVYAGFALALLVPIALEHAGVWGQTTSWDGGVIAIHSAVVDVSWRTEVMLIVSMVTMLYVSGRFGNQLAVGNHHAQEQLQLHAWHLRQLVPEDAARAPAPPTDVPDPSRII